MLTRIRNQAEDFSSLVVDVRNTYASVQPITLEVMDNLYPWLPGIVRKLSCKFSFKLTDTVFASMQHSASLVAKIL